MLAAHLLTFSAVNGVKYFSEGFIYVSNGSNKTLEGKPWVARILEIRASDEHHVYARVYWMYWPDELPEGAHDGHRYVKGRQSYHGTNELIASNHSERRVSLLLPRLSVLSDDILVDIINVVSVTHDAIVNQMLEDTDDIQNAMYWRQALDTRTMELSVS